MMGFFLSKSMEDNMKKQQEFMAANGALQLERQLLMQNEMRQRQVAMQIAWTREFLKYFGTFYGFTTVVLTAGAMKKKKPGLLAPIIPLSIILVYQYDMAYGTLMTRMKGHPKYTPAETHVKIQNHILYLYSVPQYIKPFYINSDEAENIIDTEKIKLEMPKGVPTVESIEKARRARNTFFTEK